MVRFVWMGVAAGVIALSASAGAQADGTAPSTEQIAPPPLGAPLDAALLGGREAPKGRPTRRHAVYASHIPAEAPSARARTEVVAVVRVRAQGGGGILTPAPKGPIARERF